MRILVFDTDPNRADYYNLEELFKVIDISPEIIEVSTQQEAVREIESEKFNLMIVSYNFVKGDAYEVIELIKRYRDIPCIFLDYLAHMGVSKYVRNCTAATCVYKDEAKFLLPKHIEKVLGKGGEGLR